MPPDVQPPPGLVLGPLLRHVDPVSATVWVETDQPCEVAVLGRRARTFAVGEHHYALVVLGELVPGSTTPYEVHLDGARAWPPEGSQFPPSRIRTSGRPGPFRVAFGSCRYAAHETAPASAGIPPDALEVYAARLRTIPEEEWPDALVLLGDQIYADELTPATRRWLSRHRGHGVDRAARVLDFEEYTRLYAESWSTPPVRWLLSTLPTSMIFDDHEIVDDWNTSAAWRDRATTHAGWTERVAAGLASYWVYQHLGNLSPQDLRDDEAWTAVQALAEAGKDAEPLLRAVAAAADAEPAGFRWSYVRHWGETRMVMVDSRAARVLDEPARRMLDDAEFDWLEGALRGAVDDGVRHVVVGTSLPWLLPPAIHHLERWNETLNVRHHGRPVGRAAEALRQAADLEHWAAFGRSFERLGEVLTGLARGDTGPAPASVLVLSGDVHHAYAAELVRPSGLAARVHQLTVSPLHNQAPHPIKVGFRIGWSRAARRLTAGLARLARVPRERLEWRKRAGPFFGNQLGELVLDGDAARFRLWVADRDARGEPGLRRVVDMPLTDGAGSLAR